MEQTTQYPTLEHYLRANKVSRYVPTRMLRYAKYRLTHLHGIFTEEEGGQNIRKALIQAIPSVPKIVSLNDLKPYVSNSEKFTASIEKAKFNFVAFEIVALSLLQQFLAHQTLRYVLHDARTLSVDEVKAKVDENAATSLKELAQYIEHVVYIAANGASPMDELFEAWSGIHPETVAEITERPIEMIELLTDLDNLMKLKEILGADGVSLSQILISNSLRIAQKAVEANSKPNDYDSN